jgi:hypothetical protein
VKGTPRKTAISYLGLAVTLGVIAHCSPATTPTIEPTTVAATATPGPPAGPAPAPPANPLAQFAGTYNSNFTKTRDDGCNFRPTFSGPIIVTLNPSRMQIESRVISITIQTNGSYSGQGTNTFSRFTATSTVSGQITGNQINGTESLNFSAGCVPPPKVVTYSYTGTK